MVIHGMSSSQSGSTSSFSSHPMASIYNVETAPYALLGLKENIPREDPNKPTSPPIPFANFDPFTQWQGPTPFNPGIESVVENFDDWHRRAQDKFDIERRTVLYDDPERIFMSAYEKSLQRDYRGISPHESITHILDYLKMAEPESFPAVAFHKIYADTVERLTRVQKIMDDVSAERIPDPMAGLEEIERAAQLKDGTDFFQNRLESFVRIVLEQAVLKSDGLKDAAALQLLAAQDVVKVLKEYANEPELQKLQTDVWSSQDILLGAIPSFMETFREPIVAALRKMDAKVKMSGEGSKGGPVTNTMAVMCMSLFAAPRWDPGLGMEYCRGAKIQSVFKYGPKPIVFSKDDMTRKPISDRICTYRTFMRRNKVYQDLAEAGRVIPFKQHLMGRIVLNKNRTEFAPDKTKGNRRKQGHNDLIFSTLPNVVPSVKTEIPR